MMTYLVAALSLLATIALGLQAPSNPQTSGMVLMILCGFGYFLLKGDALARQLDELTRLRAAYDQLDQQAKLIIRTDLELHRAQEELDRRLASLMSLHRLGQQLQVSVQPEEMFSKLDAPIVSSFGFENGLLGLCPTIEQLEWRSLVGVNPDAAARVRDHLLFSGLLKEIVAKPAPQMWRDSSAPGQAHGKLLELLGVSSAVIAGVIPHSGPVGCLILGHAAGGTVNAKAEEELVAILTNQLTVAVENSALYEKTWAAQQELERKVQGRTRELAEANTELVRLNKAKSDFVSAVSHELRTPLAAIKGYAALLSSGQFGALAKAQGERIGKIEKHSDLLTQLINNLLDIARIESGRVTMERRLIPVEEFLGIVHELIQPQLEAKHIRYSVDRDGVKELLGDSQHLQRVFLNLLSNAMKYTPSGGAITVGFSREGDAVRATVRDTGCGIGAEDLPKLFQEFYRAEDPINQEVRGTGLGLALVKRIIEAHQGRIWVESQKGKGSAFHVSLPAV